MKRVRRIASSPASIALTVSASLLVVGWILAVTHPLKCMTVPPGESSSIFGWYEVGWVLMPFAVCAALVGVVAGVLELRRHDARGWAEIGVALLLIIAAATSFTLMIAGYQSDLC
jgi:hypothetical protein